jgi:hypothetical protein
MNTAFAIVCRQPRLSNEVRAMRAIVTIGCFVLLSFSAPFAIGSILWSVAGNPDNNDAKVQIWNTDTNKDEIAAARKEEGAFQESLRSLGEAGFDAVFGTPAETLIWKNKKEDPPITRVLPGYAVPVFWWSAVGFSGLGYRGNHESRFYKISDIGSVLMFPYGDGKFVSAVLVCLKIDGAFVPVRSASDYRARMEWDIAKLKRLKLWVEEQAKSKGIDLSKQKP